ncbi:phosphatase PAP2 family protein [Neolewinella persica]|uniref:phosphatase PAP2 family protein n=1 Tax=Neolewinella persica TaxID=70998 RepID=UPI000371CE2C|nr:phosphatase PAP2 family protein [Neolewinella persica]
MPVSSPNSFSAVLRFLRYNWLFVGGTLLLVLANIVLIASSAQGDALVAINKLRTGNWDTFFKVGTHFAEPVAYLGVIIIVTAFSYRHGIFTIVTGALAGVFSGILKAVFAQARPMRWFFDNYEEIWHSLNLFEENWRSWDPDSSFPSGHTASAFALYGFLAFTARKRKLSVSLLCFGLAVMVGFSRMYLLYHFLRDVTAGAFLGVLIGALAYYLQKAAYPEVTWLDRGWLDFFRKREAASGKIPPPE